MLPVIAGTLLGAIFGSFLATLVVRWPEVRSIMTGRSRCDHCGTALSVGQLIPLVSYFLQRGDTVCCRKRIDPLHPVIEAVAVLIGGASFGVIGWDGYTGALLGWLLLSLAALDIRYFILPNWLNGLLLFAGLVLPMPEVRPAIADRLLGAVVGYASLTLIALLYRKFKDREGLGGGDAKLLGGIGVWVGWQSLPWVIFFSGILGLGMAAFMQMRRGDVTGTTRLPLGTLMAAVTWPMWIYFQSVG